VSIDRDELHELVVRLRSAPLDYVLTSNELMLLAAAAAEYDKQRRRLKEHFADYMRSDLE
jgi:hypothetical protein